MGIWFSASPRNTAFPKHIQGKWGRRYITEQEKVKSKKFNKKNRSRSNWPPEHAGTEKCEEKKRNGKKETKVEGDAGRTTLKRTHSKQKSLHSIN